MNFRIARQRAAVLALLEKLEADAGSLRLDMAGGYRVRGLHGWAWASPWGYGLFVDCHSSRRLSRLRRRLRRFMRVTVQGHGDGVFSFDRLPTHSEAEIVRRCLGIDRHPHTRQTRPPRPPRRRRYAGAQRDAGGRFRSARCRGRKAGLEPRTGPMVSDLARPPGPLEPPAERSKGDEAQASRQKG
jgi:hypothetical protein